MTRKTILLTGASSGVGLQIYEDIKDMYRCVTLQRRSMGAEHEFLGDLENLEELDRVLDRIRDAYPIDILVLNAGIYLPDHDFHDFVKINNVNYLANVMILQKFVQHAEKIILISSIATKFTDACNSISYGSSKMAIEYYCRCLRETVRTRNTKVIIVNPGPIETPIFPEPLLQKYADQMMKVADVSQLIVRLIEDESSVVQEEILCRPITGNLVMKE
jgi:short-subunit dehydrogenase